MRVIEGRSKLSGPLERLADHLLPKLLLFLRQHFLNLGVEIQVMLGLFSHQIGAATAARAAARAAPARAPRPAAPGTTEKTRASFRQTVEQGQLDFVFLLCR